MAEGPMTAIGYDPGRPRHDGSQLRHRRRRHRRDMAAFVLVAAVQLSAIWMLVAITVVLYGLVPRFAPVA